MTGVTGEGLGGNVSVNNWGKDFFQLIQIYYFQFKVIWINTWLLWLFFAFTFGWRSLFLWFALYCFLMSSDWRPSEPQDMLGHVWNALTFLLFLFLFSSFILWPTGFLINLWHNASGKIYIFNFYIEGGQISSGIPRLAGFQIDPSGSAEADATVCPLLCCCFPISNRTTTKMPPPHWNKFSNKKVINSCSCPTFILCGLMLFSLFFRRLHNLRSDLFLDPKCVWLCGGGRRELPSQPVWSAGTDGRTGNHQIEHRWDVESLETG